MKKIIFITLFFLFANYNVYSQDVFPLENAKWKELLHLDSDSDDPLPPDKYISYSLQGDTIIDVVKRSKLYYSPDIEYDDSVLIGFIHIDAEKVFFRANTEIELSEYNLMLKDKTPNKDLLLYDFSLDEKDLLSYKYSGFGGTYTLSEIDLVSLGEKERRQFVFSLDRQPAVKIYWIEGLGSTHSLFDPIIKIPTEGWRSSLICFSQNDEVLWLSPNWIDCHTSKLPQWNGFDKIEGFEGGSIYYVAESRLIVSSLPMQQIQIYNLNGILLQNIPLNGELHYSLSNHSLISGIYTATIRLQTGVVKTEKIIVK
ncbi:MAG: T9SS type A sorting domain-containing protein [Candidatus Symbiothrix sp.]|jgi:hypothetical protein|nr:T9SS type A sorting domain-containing protein [Candidatus Symbiothrix sp.]